MALGHRVVGITPNDTTGTVPERCVYLHVGVGGNVSVEDRDGNNDILYGIQTGQRIPAKFEIVRSTGTTASEIVAICD